MPVIIEFSRCIGTYSSAKFEYLYSFTSDAELDRKTLEFIYGKYNHKRPHTHNGGRTPHAVRYAA